MATTVLGDPVAVRPADGFARAVLRGDALTAGPFGLLLLVGARPVGAFLGWDEPLALAAIGAVCVGYAALLWRFAGRARVERKQLLVPIVVNAAWVAASAAILLGGTPDLSTGGAWAVAVVAELVALVAVAQVVALRRLD